MKKLNCSIFICSVQPNLLWCKSYCCVRSRRLKCRQCLDRILSTYTDNATNLTALLLQSKLRMLLPVLQSRRVYRRGGALVRCHLRLSSEPDRRRRQHLRLSIKRGLPRRRGRGGGRGAAAAPASAAPAPALPPPAAAAAGNNDTENEDDIPLRPPKSHQRRSTSRWAVFFKSSSFFRHIRHFYIFVIYDIFHIFVIFGIFSISDNSVYLIYVTYCLYLTYILQNQNLTHIWHI